MRVASAGAMLLLLACAPHPAPPPLLGIPVQPTPGSVGRSSFGTGVTMPKGAALDQPWASSDARVTCKAWHNVLNVDFVIPTAADWPYELPATVTCTQGAFTVTVPMVFTPPASGAWTAGDGTIVFPRNTRMASGWCDTGANASAAAMEPAMEGVSCWASGGGLCVDVERGTPAGKGTCRLTLADGTVEDKRVVVIAY